MTIKEIEKVIDEADLFFIKDGDKRTAIGLNSQYNKNCQKERVKSGIEYGYTYTFYKFNSNGKLENIWVVDHIDPEKNIVKKKLDDMTKEELIKLAKLYCKDRFNCDDCPLHAKKLSSCLTDYVSWKEAIKEYKDKEFEVEVEE